MFNEIVPSAYNLIGFVSCEYCTTSRFSSHFITRMTTSPYKRKAVPLEAWSCPEVSRNYKFPYFMTTAQDGSKFVRLTHRLPLTPENTPGVHFC